MSVRKLTLTLVLVALLVAPALAAPADPVAEVNGESISRAEFLSVLEQAAGAQILEQMISIRLLIQANRAEHLVSAEEIQKEFDEVRGQFPGEPEFLAALKENSLTPETLKQQIEAKLTLQRLAVKGVTASDEEIAKYFEDHKAELGQPEQVKASHILVATEEEAKQIAAELAAGADFVKLAAEKSQDPGSKDQGGDLGFFGRGELVPEFEEVAFTLPAGQISAPVKTQFGWHVIKVVEHRPATPATLDAVKETIRQTIIREKTKQPADVISELRGKAQVKILWP
ncbi:MAG: peptidylprolyl isomerase [Chitinophagales bacterium]